MKCIGCGNEVLMEWKYCPDCGNNIQQQVTQVQELKTGQIQVNKNAPATPPIPTTNITTISGVQQATIPSSPPEEKLTEIVSMKEVKNKPNVQIADIEDTPKSIPSPLCTNCGSKNTNWIGGPGNFICETCRHFGNAQGAIKWK